MFEVNPITVEALLDDLYKIEDFIFNISKDITDKEYDLWLFTRVDAPEGRTHRVNPDLKVIALHNKEKWNLQMRSS